MCSRTDVRGVNVSLDERTHISRTHMARGAAGCAGLMLIQPTKGQLEASG